MTTAILYILDESTHELLQKFYCDTYMISNDISSIDSSEFTLDITTEAAYFYENTSIMKKGNLLAKGSESPHVP